MSESKSLSTSSIILKLSLSYGRKTMTVTSRVVTAEVDYIPEVYVQLTYPQSPPPTTHHHHSFIHSSPTILRCLRTITSGLSVEYRGIGLDVLLL